MKITFDSKGSAKETTITVDGKEITKVTSANFDVSIPEDGDEYYDGYLSVTWSTKDQASEEGLTKRTTYQYSPRDSEEIQNISIVAVDKTVFTDEEHSHYMLAGKIPVQILKDLDEYDNIDVATLVTGHVVSKDDVTDHHHIATINIDGHGTTTFDNGHAHIIERFKIAMNQYHVHTMPLNNS